MKDDLVAKEVEELTTQFLRRAVKEAKNSLGSVDQELVAAFVKTAGLVYSAKLLTNTVKGIADAEKAGV